MKFVDNFKLSVKINRKMGAVILLVVISVLCRLIPHFPNFSPLVAVSLFSGVYFRKKFGWLLPLSIYVLSDIIIGLHDVVLFTWSSIVIIYFLGRLIKRNIISTLSYTLLSSILFFLITNFGVWFVGWYPHTWKGFLNCYILALPFFRTSLFADLFFVAVLFGVYEYFLAKRILPQHNN
jgi:hypothetical protein